MKQINETKQQRYYGKLLPELLQRMAEHHEENQDKFTVVYLRIPVRGPNRLLPPTALQHSGSTIRFAD